MVSSDAVVAEAQILDVVRDEFEASATARGRDRPGHGP
jgi:hypothetical protein